MAKDLAPDFDATTAFLKLIDPEGIFTFQTFDDDKVRKAAYLARVFHGPFEEHKGALAKLQRQGAGAFMMINKGDGVVHEGKNTCRDGASVVKVRALWVDLDGAPLEPVIGAFKPDIVVESSPQRWHGYWLTDDCPLDEFSQRQKQIAAMFDGDPKICDLPRVMRLPGFWHQKDTPFQTRMVYPE